MKPSFRLIRVEFSDSARRRQLIKHLFGLCAVWLCVFVFGTTAANAQASSSLAELRGQVTDSTGAVIPNATVTLTDTARGTSRTVTTDENGEYIFLAIQPTDYELKIEAAGGNFAANTKRVTLTIGQQANIPIQLSASGVAATVDITSGEEIVETERTQQSTVITPREILTLPLITWTWRYSLPASPTVITSRTLRTPASRRVALRVYHSAAATGAAIL